MLKSDKIGEDEWVALVTRIEEAMCVIPFTPRQEDVITLLSMAVNGNQHVLRVEDLEQQVEQLRARNKRLENRLDQILTLANLE